MSPERWFFYTLAMISLPYVILAVYRYTASLFRRL